MTWLILDLHTTGTVIAKRRLSTFRNPSLMVNVVERRMLETTLRKRKLVHVYENIFWHDGRSWVTVWKIAEKEGIDTILLGVKHPNSCNTCVWPGDTVEAIPMPSSEKWFGARLGSCEDVQKRAWPPTMSLKRGCRSYCKMWIGHVCREVWKLDSEISIRNPKIFKAQIYEDSGASWPVDLCISPGW